ncbi:MAG: hypothetical protein JXB47_14705 [Anaerolineae bacterium]|nr:hypothetical protein [Anaerolineae bacterium]
MVNHIVLIVGAAVLIIGSLMPWAAWTVLGANVSAVGIDGDGKVTLGIGVLIALVALLDRVPFLKINRPAAALLALVAGEIVLLGFSGNHPPLVDALLGLLPAGPVLDMQVGYGLYVTGAGALIALIGGVLPPLRRATEDASGDAAKAGG